MFLRQINSLIQNIIGQFIYYINFYTDVKQHVLTNQTFITMTDLFIYKKWKQNRRDKIW